jgi:Cu/Ag efflux protein CusF
MRTTRTAPSIAAVFALGLAACATKVAAPPAPVVASDVQESPGRVEAQEALTVTATVKDVDQHNRVVTLLTSSGEDIVFRAGDEVRNLAQVKRGDQVQATYYESLVIQVLKPGAATPGVTTAADADRAELGQRPGGAAAESTRVVATVVKVDKKASTVTLKGPKGNVKTLPVKNPIHLDAVKAGDLVEVTYTEAIGVAVVPPAK